MNLKKFFQYGIIVAVLCLFVIYFQKVVGWGEKMFVVSAPLILGCIFAYVLNILMVRIEKIYFPKTKNRWICKSRRAVCIFLSILLLLFIIFFVLYLVIPQVINCFIIISKDVPKVLQNIHKLLIEKAVDLPVLQQQLTNMDIDWGNIFNKLSTSIMKGTKGLLSSATALVGSVVGIIVNILVGLIFSIYVLSSKEELQKRMNRTMHAFMNETIYNKTIYVIRIVHESFSSFIVGQVTEALILGTLCALGMALLRLPYAAPIGAMVGLTALIPIFGAYIGAVLGSFMIFTVDPKQMIIFLIFLLILQQLEGNLIYPKVVGSSIGLPGIWVLAAIMIGSGLAGVTGMLIGVPITATCYKLLRDVIYMKEEEKKNHVGNNKPI